MEGENKPFCLPLSARNYRHLPISSHSQPTNKIRSQNKIKINLQRLPYDFFQSPSSMPEIHPIQDGQRLFRAVTHHIRRSDCSIQQ